MHFYLDLVQLPLPTWYGKKWQIDMGLSGYQSFDDVFCVCVSLLCRLVILIYLKWYLSVLFNQSINQLINQSFVIVIVISIICPCVSCNLGWLWVVILEYVLMWDYKRSTGFHLLHLIGMVALPCLSWLSMCLQIYSSCK